MPLLHHDDSGVTAMLEYIITFVFAFIIFTMMLSMFDGMFIKGPEKTVSGHPVRRRRQRRHGEDPGHLPDRPATGNVSTVFAMPETAAGKDYVLEYVQAPTGGTRRSSCTHRTAC